MEFKIVEDQMLIRLDRGDEIVASLREALKESGFVSASISGIGGANYAKFGTMNPRTKTYDFQVKEETMEVISLSGNYSTLDGAPYLHLHIALADQKGQVFGGHLEEATIGVTGEIFCRSGHTPLERRRNEAVGVNEWVLEEGSIVK
ncbi:MAG: DNA-binding protein [Tissierellia bacterium]|nr:DNA-binding protein [Tissierellia bacterium]